MILAHIHELVMALFMIHELQHTWLCTALHGTVLDSGEPLRGFTRLCAASHIGALLLLVGMNEKGNAV